MSLSNKNNSSFLSFSKVISLSILLIFICCGWFLFDIYIFLSTPAENPGKKIILTITPGSSFDKVAFELRKENAITDVKKFKLLATVKGALKKVKVGDFSIDTNWTPGEVLHQITNGPEALARFSFREGLTWWQTAKEIEKQGFASYESFVEVIHDPKFLKNHAIPFDNAEGFLFPDTYFLTKPKILSREQAESLASLLVKTFWRKNIAVWKRLPPRGDIAPEGYGESVADIGANLDTLPPLPLMASSADKGAIINPSTSRVRGNISPTNDKNNTNSSHGLDIIAQDLGNSSSPFNGAVYAKDPALQEGFASPLSPVNVSPEALKKLVTLGSLVERETSVWYERPRVAGVYVNRLRLNMLLQCDPTIIYGIGPSFSGVLKRSQIKDASNPYNTYKNLGLPPGPISSMGTSSLTAALTPEIHDYLYFVATGQGKGHSFSKKLEDHNKAVRLYRKRVKH